MDHNYLFFAVTSYTSHISVYWKEFGLVVLGFILSVWQIIVLIRKHQLSSIEKCAWILFILTFDYIGVLVYAIYYKIWQQISRWHHRDKNGQTPTAPGHHKLKFRPGFTL